MEKSKDFGVTPYYEDNEIQLRKNNFIETNGYQNVTPQLVNLIIQNSNLNRGKINNEIEKIKSFFTNKIIDETKIELLLNIKTNENFNKLKDEALNNKVKIARLLADTTFSAEK